MIFIWTLTRFNGVSDEIIQRFIYIQWRLLWNCCNVLSLFLSLSLLFSIFMRSLDYILLFMYTAKGINQLLHHTLQYKTFISIFYCTPADACKLKISFRSKKSPLFIISHSFAVVLHKKCVPKIASVSRTF